ncbi:MAG: UbiA family prenyltransferase [Nitrososphaerota archaeon]|jgi:4-hydroxybenzoate polyprenyltransferase|nr:UbiA family prenyltransferase [Nitrososphaerota archaeon]MDG6922028.1 UbiA family prenyltransferase [Nitrososphaerota archaeon]
MPNLSNPLAKELVYGGHLLAIGTSSIAASCSILLGRSPTFLLLLMAYLFSFGAYMLNRGSEVTQDRISNPTRTNYLSSRNKYLGIISGASFVIGYFIAFFTNLVFFLALLLPLALALVYSIGSKKLTSLIGAKRLKDRLLIKNLAIAFGWSLIPVLVGLYYKSVPLLLLSFSPFIFLRLMSNTIFFDMRDVQADREYGVRTLPVVYGNDRAYNFMNIFDCLSAAYILILVLINYFPIYTLIGVLLPMYSVIYRYYSIRHNSDLGFLCDVVADGEYLLWGPVFFIGKIL